VHPVVVFADPAVAMRASNGDRDPDVVRHGMDARTTRRTTGLAAGSSSWWSSDSSWSLSPSRSVDEDVMRPTFLTPRAFGCRLWRFSGATVHRLGPGAPSTLAEGRGNRASIRLPGHQLDGCHLDSSASVSSSLPRWATRNMKQVPDGAQNFLEWLVEGCIGFLEGCWGRSWRSRPSGSSQRLHLHPRVQLARPRPGCRLDGMGHYTAEGFQLEEPFFRGANADVT
jgi:hypothetical protein